MKRGTISSVDIRTGGQSNVVGVALLLGATVVALGVLTASIGTLVDGQTARADAERVSQDLDEALEPVESTGYRSGTVRFTDGSIETTERELRIVNDTGLVEAVSVDALVYERGEQRVAFVAGAVLRSHSESSWIVEPPPIVDSEARDSLVVGAAKLNASDQSVGGGSSARLETNVSHERRALEADEYAVAIETRATDAFERYFEERNASVRRADFDGDGIPSVVASFPGERRAYLVVHDMRLEVADG